METSYLAVDVMLGILILYWAILIGSSIWSACIRYISDGDKDPVTLFSVTLPYFGFDGDLLVFAHGVGTAFYIGLLALLNCLLSEGYGSILLILLTSIVSTLVMLRISKFVYSLNKKLVEHTNNKSIHK